MTQEADAADLRSREALDELNNARMDTRISSDEGAAYWGPELSARRRVAAMLRQGAQDAERIARLVKAMRAFSRRGVWCGEPPRADEGMKDVGFKNAMAHAADALDAVLAGLDPNTPALPASDVPEAT